MDGQMKVVGELKPADFSIRIGSVCGVKTYVMKKTIVWYERKVLKNGRTPI